MYMFATFCGAPFAAAANIDSLGQYTAPILPVVPKIPLVSTSYLYQLLALAAVDKFWHKSSGWSDQCNTTSAPVLWSVAVMSKAVANGMDQDTVKGVMGALFEYKSKNSGGFSASTAGDGDIYTDDDAQAVWAFIEASITTGNSTYFDTANKLLDFIIEQQKPDGGVVWGVQGNYLALISTVEAALAAVKSCQIVPNQRYLDFATLCLKWVFSALMSPQHFLFDGVDTNGQVNRGQLSYTVGVAISTFSLLSTIDDSDDWKSKALELAVRAIGGGELDSIFYTDAHVHDNIMYSHLLFAGFADLLAETAPTSLYEHKAYAAIRAELMRETRYLYDTVYPAIAASDGCSFQFCNLLQMGSLVETFYQASRVAISI